MTGAYRMIDIRHLDVKAVFVFLLFLSIRLQMGGEWWANTLITASETQDKPWPSFGD